MTEIQLPDFTKADLSFRDLLQPAIAIARARDSKAAEAWLRGYTEHLVTHWNRSPEQAEKIAKTNIGYFAGYYGSEEQQAVYEVFGAVHPIFGTPVADPPTVEEAIEAGRRMARGEESFDG